MKSLKTTWTGIRPLIVHNGNLANPLNPYSRAMKEISGKRKKSDSDYEELARLEFIGGLYLDDKAGPVMPSNCIEACIHAGAKKSKLGKDVQAALYVADDVVKIEYDGPRSPEAMFADPRFVLQVGAKVTTSRIIRTRPMFPTGWKLNFTLEYDESILNLSAIQKAMVDAGSLCGLCDWRPKFGRFLVS